MLRWMDVRDTLPKSYIELPIIRTRYWRQVPFPITGPPGIRHLLVLRGVTGCVMRPLRNNRG